MSLVECYVHNGVGNTSSALVNRARDVIYGYYDANGNAVPGWKAAGVKEEVYAAEEQTVAVTGVLTAMPGFDKRSEEHTSEIPSLKRTPYAVSCVRLKNTQIHGS